MSYPPSISPDYDYANSLPLSATSTTSSVSSSSHTSTLVPSMNDVNDLSASNAANKMMNSTAAYGGMMNGYNANGMAMNGAPGMMNGQYGGGGQFPPQYAQQQAYRPPQNFSQQQLQQQQYQQQQQQQQQQSSTQYASLSHPGAMPNLRAGPGQQQQQQAQMNRTPSNPTDLQQMQSKVLQQHYQQQRMQQMAQPSNSQQQQQQQQPQQQQATGGVGSNVGQNLTPYQQKQMMLNYQQQHQEQREQQQQALAQRQAQLAHQQHLGQQQQQQLVQQHSGQQLPQGKFIAPQHSGQQQQGQIVPQHSGQGMANGFGSGGGGAPAGMNGVNPAMLAPQQQFSKQMQHGMMNGIAQIGRPGTATGQSGGANGGGAINPAMMFGNSGGVQQILHQQQLRHQQQQQFVQQQQQQCHDMQPPAVPPSPALSSASQSRQLPQQQPPNQQNQNQMQPPQQNANHHNPNPLQRTQSSSLSQAHDSPSPHAHVRAMTRTPVSGMSPPPPNSSHGGQQPSTHPTPVSANNALPDTSRPMSRMSSSGGGGGWNGQQQQQPQQANGFGGAVDPRTLNQRPSQQGMAMGMGMQQQIPGPSSQQQQQGQPRPGFGPASAATLHGHPPGSGGFGPQQQQQFFQQQQQQIQQQQQQFQNPMAPPMQQRLSQDQMQIHQQQQQMAAVQGTPRMNVMPPPAAPIGLGIAGMMGGGANVASSSVTPAGSVRADSIPPITPASAQGQHQVPPPLPLAVNGGPLANVNANAQQMVMMQQVHAARLQQQHQQQALAQQQQQQQAQQQQQQVQQSPTSSQFNPGAAAAAGTLRGLPTPQEVFQQLNLQQQQQLISLPQPQQRDQLLQLQMRLMQSKQTQAQNAAASAAVMAGGVPPVGPVGIVGAGRPMPTAVPPGSLPPGLNAAPPPQPTQPPQPLPHQLPAHLAGKVDPRMLVVKPLPWVRDEDDVTHGGALPELTELEIKKVQQWIKKDRAYIKVVEQTEVDRKVRNAKEAADAAGQPRWFEVDGMPTPAVPGQKLTVLWPHEKRKQRKAKIGRAETRFPLEYPTETTDAVEELVPIRLEVEFEQYRFRDTFVWNLNDPIVTVEKFATTTCEDFLLPSSMAPLITRQIQEQLTEHKATDLQNHVNNATDPVDVDEEHVLKGKMEDSDETWWEGWRKRLRTGDDGEFVRSGGEEEEGELKRKIPVKAEPVVDAEDELKVLDVMNLPTSGKGKTGPELRIMIKLDIMVGAKHLVDQFEWDITETLNSPELFAETYVAELGLGGEFRTAIAHDIREQVNMYQRALISVGHGFDGGTIFDDDLRQALLPPVSIAGRTAEQAASCMPILNNLSEGEVENNEKEREKELKRKKRQGRGRRGAILPEREPLKTHRTLPGCADVAALVPAPAPISIPSRRQAAVNASQTIASLVAQENNNGYVPVVHTPTRDSGFLAPPTGAGGSHQTRASKRQKTGHVAAPPLPQSVYLPRAKRSPTYAPPSTGVKPPPKTQERIQADNEARENERAKLPEWHCSTCGCPDSIAIGRRKGPKGDKSQCGPCGKYYHRYRRTKDVEYNPDPEYHMRLKQAELERKKRKRPVKGRKPAADESGIEPVADVNSPIQVDDDDDEDDEDDGPPLANARNASPPRPTRRVRSPDSSPSPPLAATRSSEVKSPANTRNPTPPPQQPLPPPPAPVANVVPPPAMPRLSFNPDTPEWMLGCLQELQARYEHDRFGAIIRPPQPGSAPGSAREWRIKCYDCPGKVYTPGPDETLNNFEVHLKNKRHRDNVNGRLAKEQASSEGH